MTFLNARRANAPLATGGGWPDGAFPGSVAAEPDDARAKLWDVLSEAHEPACRRLHT